jgi:DNA primase
MEIPRLHPDTIEEVKQRVDIVDVIADRVVLRKRGRDYVGLCPFHDEKTPSFSVSPSKQLYYCFGCAAGGNAFKFLMELKKESFNDVVLDLAQRYQVPIKTLEPQQRQELQRQLSRQEQLYEILAVTTSFYQHALRQPQGEIALNYLKTERQLREETIEEWKLGYAPAGWETLYRYLVEAKRYSVNLVEEAGLIVKRKSGNGYCDRFRDRLTIPIHDTQGRIIGFGSRTLGSEQPKYLNSPETPLFDKSKTLFALDKAKASISKQDQAVVVEGYFDAIALHAAGIDNAVASLGTAFSLSQLQKLLRYSESKQVVLNFDADTAGTQATQRAIQEIEALIYSGQVQLRILHLPGGKDADEFLKSDPDAVQIYRESLENAPLWIDWQIQQLVVHQDLKQADQFQQVAKKMIELLARIQDANQRTHYITHCAALLSQGESQLVPLYAKNLVAQLKKPTLFGKSQEKTNLTIASKNSLLEEAEALLLLIYLHCPEHRQEIIDALEEKDLLFSLSHHRFLWQQILTLKDRVTQSLRNTPDSLLSLLQESRIEFPEQMNRLTHLLDLDETNSAHIFRASLRIKQAIATLEYITCEKYWSYCLEQWQKLDPTKEPEQMRYYYQELEITKQTMEELKPLRLTQNEGGF